MGFAQPMIHYILHVDEKDLSVFNVTMELGNMPGEFRVAMFAHPEYDDRYWRYVENFYGESPSGKVSVIREDSSLWLIVAPHGKVLLHYSIHLPEQKGQRAAWRPFLSPEGGLIGDYHAFMYVVNASSIPSYVSLEIPSGWQAMTGLEPGVQPFTFYASSSSILLDAPILVGHFKKWSITVDGIPHYIAYWSLPGAKSFDSATLLNSIQKIVQQCSRLFGGLPYQEYYFLLQDGSYGALEHGNSVTIGAPAKELAENIDSYLPEIAHEYFHNWNIIRIRPAEYGDLVYKRNQYSRGLWWSEGLTMFYADLIMRRAHLPTSSSSRVEHLERLMSRYFSNSGNMKISPELVSMAAYAKADALGDYSASTHLQGELIGAMLDLMIRDATNGNHSIDDVMREMFVRFGDKKGFTGADIERVTANICHCEEVHSFFDEHIRGNKPPDFNRWLGLIGLRYDLSWKDAVNDKGVRAADLRVYAWEDDKDKKVRIAITDPLSSWGRAGIHTGDQILSVNGKPVEHSEDFYQSIRQSGIGDSLSLEIKHFDETGSVHVVVGGYQQAVVHIEQMENVDEKQQSLFSQWQQGK